MQAITYDRFGAARDVLTLSDIPSPAPGAGEVRVTLAYSGVNPSDVKSRAGTRPGVTKPAFPLIVPHSDGAGEIVAVGTGVDSARIGQKVWIWNGQWQRSHGTAAQEITLPAAQAVPLPDGTSLETGATLGIPGLTACHAVFGGGDIRGKTLLIQGGGGSVGYLAVQFARWGGARVIATCSARDRDRVAAAGADVVLDYRAPDLAAEVLAANGDAPVDSVVEVEFGRNITVDAEVIAPNGRLAAYGSAAEMSPTLPFGPLLFKAATIDIILIYLLPAPERTLAIEKLHAALDAGALDSPIDAVFPLAETAAAHEAVEAAGRVGATLIACQS
ncbi:NADPH:quinone reductase [uncultured Sulfitobacter sp.]|uniref:NADPH:quinone reductase n=1 Tax=uncultured Sulfitobacter sp. TaxID=191468 RepID=UPI002616A447|nr:NADPH:quinone reductase [uncultured Sulfitobacter sp.]